MIRANFLRAAGIAAGRAIALRRVRASRRAPPQATPRRAREKVADVPGLPRHPRLAHRVSRGLSGAARSPASTRPTSSRRCKDYKSGERSASVDARDRRVAVRRRTWPTSPRTTRNRRLADEAMMMTRARVRARRRSRLRSRAAPARRRRHGRRRRRRSRKSARPATAWTATARRRISRSSPASIRDYLAKALRDYKSGARKNPIMGGIAPAAHDAGHRQPAGVLRSAAGGVAVAVLTRRRSRPSAERLIRVLSVWRARHSR